jgi:hypothetical protein
MNTEIEDVASIKRLKVRKILSVPEASLPDLKFLGGYQ